MCLKHYTEPTFIHKKDSYSDTTILHKFPSKFGSHFSLIIRSSAGRNLVIFSDIFSLKKRLKSRRDTLGALRLTRTLYQMWRIGGCVIVLELGIVSCKQLWSFVSHNDMKTTSNLMVLLLCDGLTIRHYQDPDLVDYDTISWYWAPTITGFTLHRCATIFEAVLLLIYLCGVQCFISQGLLKNSNRLFLVIARLHTRFNVTTLLMFVCLFVFSKTKIQRCSLALSLSSALCHRLKNSESN